MHASKLQLIEFALLLALGARVSLDRLPRESGFDWLPVILTHPSLKIVATGLSSVLLLVHHWRRELLVAYAALAVHVVSQVLPTAPLAAYSPWIPYLLDTFPGVGIIMGLAMSLLFPLPDLTVVHGEYKTIGCYTARYGGIECRVFYPSSKDTPVVKPKDRVAYLHHGQHLAKGISHFSRVPAWLFSNFQNAYLAAIENAPLAPSANPNGWPLVIYSHGLAGSLELYSAINQQLASEGNIVVVVNHCDGSASVFRSEDDRIHYYQRVSRDVLLNVNGEGFRFRNSQLRHRVQEVRRVVNAVSTLSKQKTHPVLSHTNVEDLHIVGHSFGAATAMTAAHVDERFRTAVLLDAWMEPVADDVLEGLGSRIPVLHLISDQFERWTPNMDRMRQHAKGCTHPDSRLMVVRGTYHNNFSDLPLFSPTINRLARSAGPINPTRALRLIGQLSGAFLRSVYVDALKEFPEVVDI
ncbi:hypothetical protein ATCC90586_000099 [Pythium insidiosum]|nr:hypothetical protein ATCC90586_000099 [Pythium insidiosum]